MNKLKQLHKEIITNVEDDGINDSIEESMAITKDIAIKFSLWQQQGNCEWILNDEDEWYIPYNPHVRINTEQLFNIFLLSL